MSLAYLNAVVCQEPHKDAIWGVSWTPDDRVLSVSADGTIKQWDSGSGQITRAGPHHPLGFTSLSTSQDGRYALFNSVEGLTQMWDLQSGGIVGKFESYARPASGQLEPSWSVSLHPKATTYASCGGSGNVLVHSTDPTTFGQHRATLSTGRVRFGLCCAYSPDGNRIAMALETGQIYIFDAQASELSATYTSHAMSVRTLSWSPDSSLLLSGSEDKRLILHDVRVSPSGRHGSGAVASLTGHSSWVLSTQISPDGKLALSGSADKTIKVWDLSARTAVSTIQDTGEVWSVSWRPHPSGSNASGAFVTGGEDGHLRWWRAAGTA